jgi:hypothetical protein
MARGYKSLHPLAEEVLRNLGVKSSQVSQGWGTAVASAGYHKPVGTSQGRRFSHCVDLSPDLISSSFMDRLWEAGFVAFARDDGWGGNRHIHAIHLGIVADDGKAHLLNGPRMQIADFLKAPPLDGLQGHNRLSGQVPNVSQQAELRRQYAAWLPDYPTRILAPGGQQINCYAWLEDDAVTVEMDSFLQWWGKTLKWWGNTVGIGYITEHGGSWSCDGRFERATVRQLAQSIGLKIVSFKWAAGHNSATVQLSY